MTDLQRSISGLLTKAAGQDGTRDAGTVGRLPRVPVSTRVPVRSYEVRETSHGQTRSWVEFAKR
jgi:hypothetical protein